MNENTPLVQVHYLRDNLELKHYKRECLLLCCALYEACLALSNNDKNKVEVLMNQMIKNEKTFIYSMTDSAIDDFLNQFKS